jgi:hypothetical protein
VHRSEPERLSQLPGATPAIPSWLPTHKKDATTARPAFNRQRGGINVEAHRGERLSVDWALSHHLLRHNRDKLYLRALHLPGSGRLLVVKPMEMEQSMRDVQAQLSAKRIAKSPCVGSRYLDADKDLSMLKCNYIRRTRKMKKTAMQFRHAPVRNQNHV